MRTEVLKYDPGRMVSQPITLRMMNFPPGSGSDTVYCSNFISQYLLNIREEGKMSPGVVRIEGGGGIGKLVASCEVAMVSWKCQSGPGSWCSGPHIRRPWCMPQTRPYAATLLFTPLISSAYKFQRETRRGLDVVEKGPSARSTVTHGAAYRSSLTHYSIF